MQRLEPRELAAAALAAIVPALWVVAAGRGLVPDVFDTDVGAGFGVAVAALRRGESFLPASLLASGLAAASGLALDAAARLTFAVAVWSAGYGGWRFARTFLPEAGALGAACVAAAAQLGPWTTEPLGLGALGAAQGVALGIGPTLLGLAHPRLGLVVGAWSPGVGLVVALGGALRRRWSALLALGGLLPLLGAPALGGAYTAASPSRTVPTYAGAAGAWFPLPPGEASKWTAAAAAYGGRWVHPLSGAVSGLGPDARPTTALPLAVEAAVVPAPPALVAPSVWAAAHLPAGAPRDWARGSGLESGLVPLGGALLGGAAVLLRRRRIGLIGLAAVCVVSGVGLSLPAPAGAARVHTADLLAVAAAAPPEAALAFFPPPEPPFVAGRVSLAQAALVRAAAGSPAADLGQVDVAALARLAAYGLDTEAAQRLSEAAPIPALGPAGVALVVDVAALPPWLWADVRRALEAAGATEAGGGEGALRVYAFAADDPGGVTGGNPPSQESSETPPG